MCLDDKKEKFLSSYLRLKRRAVLLKGTRFESQARKEYEDALESITKAISELDDEMESEILYLKFINGLNTSEIMSKMNYSSSSVSRLYHKALTHVKIQK